MKKLHEKDTKKKGSIKKKKNFKIKREMERKLKKMFMKEKMETVKKDGRQKILWNSKYKKKM